MFAYETDKVIELFNECIEGSLLPKFIQHITKYSYIQYYNELQKHQLLIQILYQKCHCLKNF